MSQVKSDIAPPQGPYTVRRNIQGHAEAVECDGYTVLILACGAERNEAEADRVVAFLNRGVPLTAPLAALLAQDAEIERLREENYRLRCRVAAFINHDVAKIVTAMEDSLAAWRKEVRDLGRNALTGSECAIDER